MATDFDNLVADLERSYEELQARMSDPAVYNDHREAADVGRRLKELERPYKLAQEWEAARDDLAAAREDSDLRELVPELEERTGSLQEELRLALVPTDPADRKDVIVEVRQGVGGDEAALWAGDVYRMLSRYAERRGFKVEQLEASPSDGGGYKEATFAVKGDGAYSVFKWEGGTHRADWLRPARGENPHLQLPREPAHGPSGQAHGSPARPDPPGRARRVHRGADDRGPAPRARGVTARDALGEAERRLAAAGVETPRADAEWLGARPPPRTPLGLPARPR